MSSSLGDFVAAYFFLGAAIVTCVIISISAYHRPGRLRLFGLANNIMTIAQASCTVAYCYELVDLRVICLLFFICRLGWVTLTSFTLLILGKRIQKNRSPVTRALVICILEPMLILYTVGDVACIVLSAILPLGYPPFWLFIAVTCVGLAAALGCNLFAFAPLFRHSYMDPVTKPVASVAIWYFVTLPFFFPCLFGQYIAIFIIGDVWHTVTWIVVEGCLRVLCQIIFGIKLPSSIIDPLLDFMQPKLHLQIISIEQPEQLGNFSPSRTTT